ncbi:MAG: phosphoribosylaminoimidazolesuccinocarboxamide synthase [Phycisphaeraceae bacterium]|nr:phosphoribosylaminoimidazolesuccinocarboxamide synthase [Phycisphaeraceae bacterium]
MARPSPDHGWESAGALFRTELALSGGRIGKVRDVYDLPPAPGRPPALLIVATDRISAFDVVLDPPIPGKGVLLTQLAAWWLRWLDRRGLGPTHLLGTDAGAIPAAAFTSGGTTRESLRGRVTIARRCRVLPIEFVVRGYLEGSGWAEYQDSGSVCGVALPPGLSRCARLPEPVFTPATKATTGHDLNITFEQAAGVIGADLLSRLAERSLSIYREAAAHALDRGIIIADTKFEFGIPVDEHGHDASDDPILIDEALTPDSSRFWPADRYEPGHPQPSYDKQFVREYLETVVARGGWDKSPPGPRLPDEVVRGTLERYREAVMRLTGDSAS